MGLIAALNFTEGISKSQKNNHNEATFVDRSCRCCYGRTRGRCLAWLLWLWIPSRFLWLLWSPTSLAQHCHQHLLRLPRKEVSWGRTRIWILRLLSLWLLWPPPCLLWPSLGSWCRWSPRCRYFLFPQKCPRYWQEVLKKRLPLPRLRPHPL